MLFCNDVSYLPTLLLFGIWTTISLYGSKFWVKNCDFDQKRVVYCLILIAVGNLSLCFSIIPCYELPKYTVWKKSVRCYNQTLVRSLRKLVLTYFQNSCFEDSELQTLHLLPIKDSSKSQDNSQFYAPICPKTMNCTMIGGIFA